MTTPAAWPQAALPQAIDVLTGQAVPFPLKALAVDASGRIARREHGEVVFSFAVVGTEFRACARSADARSGAGGVQIAVEADLARLPFSAESPDARRELQRLAAESRLAQGRLVLVDQRQLSLSTRIDVPAPASPIDVIAGLVAMVLVCAPFTRIGAAAGAARRARRLSGPGPPL
jgi:hypothetical protein